MSISVTVEVGGDGEIRVLSFFPRSRHPWGQQAGRQSLQGHACVHGDAQCSPTDKPATQLHVGGGGGGGGHLSHEQVSSA